MILLEDPQQTIDFTRMQRNKLLSMKDHLETLLRKKYRLEVEIKSLRKTISQRANSSEKTLKLQLRAEDSQEVLSPSEVNFLNEEYPILLSELKEFDALHREINLLIEEVSQLER